MHHEQRVRRDARIEATTLQIALAEPSRDSAHLLALLRERLARLTLPAPTLDLSLHAEDIARRAPPNAELFPTPASEQDGLTRLIERLQARLGPEQLIRIAPTQDHRPERATVSRVADATMRPMRSRGGDAAAATSPKLRPVWLMHQPEPLRERDARPLLDGHVLQLLSGPERIETGWWDAGLVERDYYIAQQPGGALVWIYYARRPMPGRPNWFLQGRFA